MLDEMPAIERGRYDEYHDVFSPPPDDARLWRYIDLTKLLALLEDRALHFCRADLLGDPFEGSVASPMAEPPERAVDEHGVPFTPEAIDGLRKAWPQLRQARNAQRRWTYVSCWNRSEIESDALWGRYVRADAGIAIRTTFARLVRSFGEPAPPVDQRPNPDPDAVNSVYIGSVSYVDYATALWPGGNLFWPFVHKRLSFLYEAEVRAVVSDIPTTAAGIDYLARCPPSKLIAVNLDELVESVFVSPVAPDWFADLTDKVVRHYGLTAPVRQSELAASPQF
jgi:hypothetical protein